MYLPIKLIGKCHEELSTSESIELIIYPLFSETIVNDPLSLSCAVDSLSELVEVRVFIEVAPEDLTIVRIISTSKPLLATVVEERDTSSSEREDQSALE